MAHLPPGQTMQPTALVHEAYRGLVGRGDVLLESGRHFFLVAARAMRDILVERARRKAGPSRAATAATSSWASPPPRRSPRRCWPSTRRWPNWSAIMFE